MKPCVGSTEQCDKFVVNDLDHLLNGGETLQNIYANGSVFYPCDKVADDLQVYIGFEQGKAHLAHGFGNIGFGKPPFTTQALEYILQFFGKAIEHNLVVLVSVAGDEGHKENPIPPSKAYGQGRHQVVLYLLKGFPHIG